MVKPLPSLARLQELLTYNGLTGELSLANPDDAETKIAVVRNRRTVTIDKESYVGARIVWKLLYGTDPLGVVDHKDGNTLNDKPDNLRDITKAENSKNRARAMNNTSGCTGVISIKETTKFVVVISINGKKKSLGVFNSLDAAIAARKAAEIKHGYHQNHDRPPQSEMKIHPDAKIIDRLGGTNKVASICEVKPPSVSAWRIYGIPEPRLMYLQVAYPQAFVEPEDQVSPAPDEA